jgi:hypothetical protein
VTESEVRYIQRLPEQMERALRKVRHYQVAYERYGMSLEREAQLLLEMIYGQPNPGQAAELEYQVAKYERDQWPEAAE